MKKVATNKQAQSLTCWDDPFIAELHTIRAQLIKEAGNDMHQLTLNASIAAKKMQKLIVKYKSQLAA